MQQTFCRRTRRGAAGRRRAHSGVSRYHPTGPPPGLTGARPAVRRCGSSRWATRYVQQARALDDRLEPDARQYPSIAISGKIISLSGIRSMVIPVSAKCAGGSTWMPYCPTIS